MRKGSEIVILWKKKKAVPYEKPPVKIYPAPEVGYVSSTTILSDRTLVQFSVPNLAWSELENSKRWRRFVKRLEKCQREHIQSKHSTGQYRQVF